MRPEDLAFEVDALNPPTHRPAVRVTWLGTAGFAIEHDGHVILIDPYVTRLSLWSLLARPLRSDLEAVRRHAPRADAIVAGHTHFDHVLDVPAIARLTGARVFGSRSCVGLCRASGLPEAQLVDVEDRSFREPMRAEVGPFELRFVPSVHSPLLRGRIPVPGDIADCDQIPLRAGGYRCGATFGVDVRVAGRRIYHVGSADLIDGLPERDVDLALLCVAGWRASDRFVPRVLGALRPRAVLLSHWDDFLRPLGRPARPLPAMQMPGLVDAITTLEPRVRVGTVPLLGELRL